MAVRAIGTLTRHYTCKSYFFPTPAEEVARGPPAAESGRRPVRDDGLVDGRGRGVHLLGLDELHLRSAGWITFFFLVVAHERSGQLRTSIIRRKNFQRSHWAFRVEEKVEMKMVDDARPTRCCLLLSELTRAPAARLSFP